MKKFAPLFCVFLTLLALNACNNNVDTGDDDKETKPTSSSSISIPTITPAAGDYSEGFKEISITTETTGADIFYTTDGTEPTQSSNRYTGAFTIIGSKTVRAVAYSGNTASKMASASYNLNAGKTSSQLGIIKGTFSLASNLSDDLKTELASSTVYISSPDLPGVVKQGKMGESFYIDGLDTAKSYTFFFSNKAPGVAIEARSVQRDENGMPIVSTRANVKPEEGNGTDLGEVPLKQTGTITGIAKKYGEDGTEETDHAGITVFIPGTSYSAYTAKDGSFSMTTVPQGMYTIRAMYAGYTFAEQENILLSTDTDEIPVANIETPFEVTYAKGTVKGTALLGDRTSGFSGIDVVLSDAANAHSYSATTTATGNWTVNDVTPGTYSIEFHKDGYVDQTINDILVTGAKVTTVARIVLKEDGGSISGTVTVANAPTAGVSVIAERSADEAIASKTYYALSTANGSFSFESVAPGLYTITAAYPGYRNVSQANVSVSIGDAITLPDLSISEKTTYSVTGSCVLAGMESGFEGTSVLLQNAADSSISKSTVTNSEGVYTISDIDAGSYVLTFSRNGFITNSSVTVEVGAKSIAVAESVVLQSSAGSVNGTVTLESAQTNEGIAILISKENDSTVSYSTVTDTNGRYAITGITPGTYRVQATKNGYNTGISDPFTVSSGDVQTVSNMQLSISLRSLYGTVTLEGKTDYAGVRITATKTTSTTEIYSALSNKDGFYALSGMTPGDYILSYSYEGYRSATSSSVSLSEDSSLNLDAVGLVKATGKISGIVNLEGCTDHSGIKVSVVGTDYTYITESDGAYEFTVPSGNYPGGVRFEKEDYQLTAKAETIPALTDSTYGVLTVEMKAIANTVRGVIDLLGSADESGISVTVDEYSSVEAATSAEDGSWTLLHVPVNVENYITLRFKRVNTPDVTKQIKVIPNDYIDVGKLEMIPDSATLKGHVFLDGMTDNANINVTVTTDGKDDIVVRTTSDGAFEVTNILASGSHTVTFSKDGWDSQNFTVDDFEPLEERVIGTSREYVLKDTTAPAWGSAPVTINSGANFANSTKLHIDLTPVEKGSGIEKMSVQITRTVDGETSALYPSIYNWQNYQIGFDFDLGELPDQYVGNGTYRLYVTLKDKSGNVSETAEKAITMTDLMTSLAGVLTGDKLHLTEEGSPYIVEADCFVSGTLTIEPGTEVRFTGNYSIKVNGSIFARGSKEKKILFTSNCVNQPHTYKTSEWGEYQDTDGNWQWGEHEVEKTEVMTVYWNGIIIQGGDFYDTQNTYNYTFGNILEYCDFEYASSPLSVNFVTYVKGCNFHNCRGGVSFSVNMSRGDNSNNTPVIMNNIFENGVSFSAGDTNNKYSYIFVNNYVCSGYSSNSTWGPLLCLHNTFEDLSMFLDNFDGLMQHNSFIGSSICCQWVRDNVTLNNFIDCPSPIVSTSSEGAAFDFPRNYWGEVQTQELERKGNLANVSFITDFYDNFNLSKIGYSNWATEPFENCGYSETGFVAFDYAVNGYDFTSGGYYPESTSTSLSIEMNPQYHENPITQMRLAQTYEELKSASWTTYSSRTNFTVDKTKLVNGAATLYVQVKDSMGNTSSAVCHNIPYDTPVCYLSLQDGTTFGSTAKKQELRYHITDLGNITSYTLSMDGSRIASESGNSWGTYAGEWSYQLPLAYMASGIHTLKLTATDSAGNTGETSVSFTINRNFDESTVKDITYNSTTGQFYKDANTLHLWHLDNDGKEDSGTAEITSYTHTNGGFEGAASYLNGDVPLDISTNAFTVEFWTRGMGNLDFNKESLLRLQNGYWSPSNYWHYFWHVYKKTESEIDTYGWWGENSARNRSDDQWHYWVYVYDGTYTAIYCDGVCVSYQDGFTHTLNTSNDNLHIEASGIVDEIRISNKARSADEINSYYKTAKPILDANTGSLDAIVW